MSHIVRRDDAIFVKSVVFFLSCIGDVVVFRVRKVFVLRIFAKIAVFSLIILRKIAIFIVFTVFNLRKP